MQYDQRHSKTMIVCLKDSIFKDKLSSATQKQQENIHQRQIDQLNQGIRHSTLKNCLQRNLSIQFLNASYYGKTTHCKEPSGLGIFIDDQFNFFLSNWKQNHKMNGLTFVMLLNGTKLYGTWIDGKPSGWSCIQTRNGVKIFIEMKTISQGKSKIDTPVFVIDEIKKIAYLTQVQLSEFLYTKIQIINRKQIHSLFKRNQETIFIYPKDIFEEMTNFKIPEFLFSFEDFLSHLHQNVQGVEVTKIQKNFQQLTFLSIKETNKVKNTVKSDYFVPFLGIKSNEKFSEKSIKKLGILMTQRNYKMRAIGQFSDGMQLTGKGLSFPFTSQPSSLFGIFKFDMLIKQFQHPEPFDLSYFKSRQLKKQLTQHHMRLINFVHNFVYFNEIDSVMKLAKQIKEFVHAFQQEYTKKYGKEVESFSHSQNEYEQGKYCMHENIDFVNLKKKNSDNQRQFQDQENVFIKRKQSFVGQSQKIRPFGKIVNSRSPLRQLSHSKSPSQIETYRQQKLSPSPIISSKKSLQKNLMISINSFSNQASNKYNVETMRNKSNYHISYQKNDYSNKKDRFFLAHHRQVEKQDDILQTIRIKNDKNPVKIQHMQYEMQQIRNNFYSRHLRNNFMESR